MKRLNQHVLFLPLSEKLDAFFVGVDNHIGKYAVTLTLGTDFTVVYLLQTVATLTLLFSSEVFSLNSELEVELAASLERFLCVVCITLDVL